MVEIGYKLSSEEFGPLELIEQAERAEAEEFSFSLISDHYHPWIRRQGQSPFAWCTLGGIAQTTSRLEVITAVTCPTTRYHPALVAQMAATIGVMMPGRFSLGVGTGENLNEHIYGDRWPPAPIRIEMLAEAVDLIRTLWQGGMQDYYGTYYTVENAQLFTLPEELPPIFMAAEDEISAMVAARIGDGLIHAGSKPEEVMETFIDNGGRGKPKYVEFSAAYAENEEKGRRTAYEEWPIAANAGDLNWELPTPTHFEQLHRMVTEEDVAKKVIIGPDANKYIDKINRFVDADFDHICVHQIGANQKEFVDFFKNEVLPSFR